MYKLGDHIELIVESLPDNSNEYIVAVYKNKYKDFVVNKTIFDFLLHFKEPNTLESVAQLYLDLTQAKDKQHTEVVNQLKTFFNGLVNKGWIVDEHSMGEVVSYHTFYKKGDRLDEYVILKVLADNELTDVYLTKTADSKKKYVIKFLNPQKFRHQKRYRKYSGYIRNEFDFLKTFNSNYINKGVKFKSDPDRTYMVLQYINGQSLYRYVKKNRLTTTDKKKLVTKILRGFSLIHKNAIYHGDIHLSNVLITPKGQIKIIDFGYSNPTQETDTEEQKLRNGGVHAFIPPERALRSIDRKFNAIEQFQSEVYQIGLLVYYIFVKKLPFESETWKTMVDEKSTFDIRTHEPLLKRRMPKQIREFIFRSLESAPKDRYENATSMLQAWLQISN